jgi:hypothetical protein
VVAIGQQRAGAPEVPVEPPRQADRQALHPASERPGIVGLADDVKVTALYAELDQSEPEALAPGGDAPADDAKGAAIAERLPWRGADSQPRRSRSRSCGVSSRRVSLRDRDAAARASRRTTKGMSAAAKSLSVAA